MSDIKSFKEFVKGRKEYLSRIDKSKAKKIERKANYNSKKMKHLPDYPVKASKSGALKNRMN